MRRTVRNLPYHELIGLEVTVVSHSDPSLIGVRGKIVDEGANTLRVAVKGGTKVITVLKRYGAFELVLPESGKKVILDGTEIVGRPEDRLKRIALRSMRWR